ncbi:hypothetical protein PIB30_059282 [Stylosanthes scabra]|uniref:DUF4283 domain-containing protein n=1 Tax=Stylosanthes scabra TaxID=79078 RepID=A0ABU6RKK3_9FABA|nr:hypothetical protein [Stylosanthes scabra]
MGRVLDVFLSRKKRKRNKLMFEFVRFETKIEADGAIQELHGWKVWGCKLEVTESKYRKDGEGSSHVRGWKRMSTHEEKCKEIETAAKGRNLFYGRAFKDAVENCNRDGTILNLRDKNLVYSFGYLTVVLATERTMMEKLNRSLIGESTNPIQLVVMRDTIMKQWSDLEEVELIGPRNALLTFSSEEMMAEAGQSPLLLNNFVQVRKWLPGEVNDSRRIWLVVYGLPLYAWNEENMAMIGRIWGSVIHVETNQDRHYCSFQGIKGVDEIENGATLVSSTQNLVENGDRQRLGGAEDEVTRVELESETGNSNVAETPMHAQGLRDGSDGMSTQKQSDIGPMVIAEIEQSKTRTWNEDRETIEVVKDSHMGQKSGTVRISRIKQKEGPVNGELSLIKGTNLLEIREEKESNWNGRILEQESVSGPSEPPGFEQNKRRQRPLITSRGSLVRRGLQSE